MKNLKKLFAMFLAVVMVLSLSSVSAFATGDGIPSSAETALSDEAQTFIDAANALPELSGEELSEACDAAMDLYYALSAEEQNDAQVLAAADIVSAALERAETENGPEKATYAAGTATMYPYKTPSSYARGSTNGKMGDMTVCVGETAYYESLPLMQLTCPHCGQITYMAPMYYAGALKTMTISDTSVIGNQTCYETKYSGDGIGVGTSCMGLSFKALKEGQATVSFTYYVAFDENVGEYLVTGNCGHDFFYWNNWFKYTEKFTIKVTSAETTYTLTYDDGVDDTSVSNMPSPITESKTGTAGSMAFTVSNTVPEREGYTFLGWADSANATKASYQAGDTITLTSSSSTKTIYAVWEAVHTHSPGTPTDNGNGTHTTSGCTDPDCPNKPDDVTAEHIWGDWETIEEPSCTEKGEKTRKCSVCGATETEEIDELGHNWGDWTVTKEATCTGDGERTRMCTRDSSHTETETIPATGHTVVTDEAVAATCTETGLTKGSHCSVCGEVIKAQEEIAATGHSWGEWTDNGGDHKHICTVCGAEETASHTWGDWTEIRHPTETTPGEEKRICSDCGAEETNEIPAVKCENCTWGDWETVTVPSCTEKGEQTRECSVCGATETKEIDALGHDFTEEWENDANSHWHKCSRCDATSEIAKHVWNDGVVTKEPNATEPGVKTYTCTECGATKTEDIPITPDNPEPEPSHVHEWGPWTTIISATCTENGYQTRSCSCGASESRTIPATGHAWGEWKVTTPAEVGVEGEETRICANDASHVETRPVEALPEPEPEPEPEPVEPEPVDPEPEEDIEPEPTPLAPEPEEDSEPEEDIELEPTPLAPEPVDPESEEEIEPDETPLEDAPFTGDDSIFAWSTLSVSLLGLAVLALTRKRGKHE